MAIELTDVGFNFKPILATNPTIPDNRYKPNKIMHEWIFAAQGVGDGSGGTVLASVDFGIFDKNHYICITWLNYINVTSCELQIVTHTDRWDNLYFPGHVNEQICIYCNTSSHAICQHQQLQKPIYLGRPRLKDANPGLSGVYWMTNTNSETYNFTMQGYTLERPLPFTSILQP